MKKTSIILGDLIPGPGQVSFDLGAFCAPMDGQRLLATATSGAGKTHMLKRILEQTHGLIPQMVIDPESEFYTLRSKYPDYLVLGGDHGDKPLHVDQAHTLARMLLDLRASVVLDLFHFGPKEKERFVANFIQALLDAPKDLWGDWEILVDEAQLFAPEEGSAESLNAMVGLATRGRKRGLASIFATLRLAMISKNLASMCRNKLVGGFDMELDLKRAAAELGMGKEGVELIRGLDRGEFFAYGRIFGGKGIRKLKIGPVETGKTVAGRKAKRVAPDAKIKAALAKLAALPARAAQEAKDLGEAKARIKELEGQLRQVKVPPPAMVQPGLNKGQLVSLEARIRHQVEKEAEKRSQKALAGLKQALIEGTHKVSRELSGTVLGAWDSFGRANTASLPSVLPLGLDQPPPRAALAPASAGVAMLKKAAAALGPTPTRSEGDGPDQLQQKILDTIAMLDQRGLSPNRVMVARWQGIHPTGGRYGSNLARLKEMGLLEPQGTRLTSAGQGQANPGPTGLDAFKGVLEDTQRKIVEVLSADRATAHGRESLAAALGIHPTGGRYGSNLARLKEMGAIPEKGPIKLVDQVFK